MTIYHIKSGKPYIAKDVRGRRLGGLRLRQHEAKLLRERPDRFTDSIWLLPPHVQRVLGKKHASSANIRADIDEAARIIDEKYVEPMRINVELDGKKIAETLISPERVRTERTEPLSSEDALARHREKVDRFATMYGTGRAPEPQHQPGGGGLRYDSSKPRLDLIPPEAITRLGQVLTKGAEKYAARNWELGMDRSRVIACAMRHLVAYMSGELNDPETGLPHTAHLLTNAAFLIAYDDRKTCPELDSRSTSAVLVK